MNLRKTFKKYLLLILIPSLMITVTSCYDDYGMSVSDYDIVLTLFDENAEFGEYKTFFIPDTVFHITESGEDSELLSREYDSDIIERIKANLLNLNYTQITDPENNKPDVVVVAAATANRNINIYQWFPPYYPGYPWYPGGGWYYPWTGVTAYDLGTLVIVYMDADDIDLENEKFKAIWSAGINGVLQRSSSELSRINSYIDQAFKQSPYLAPNQ